MYGAQRVAKQNEAAAVDDTRSTAVRDALSDAVTLSLQSVQYTLVQVGGNCCLCPLPPAFYLRAYSCKAREAEPQHHSASGLTSERPI
jgi:hypothetical protein